MKKELKRLLKQYYIIKTEYSEALMEYETAKRVVRYWFPFDNQEDKNFILSKTYHHIGVFTSDEIKKVAKDYNKDFYEEHRKDKVYKQRSDAQKHCANCKKRVKELNNQLQVVCEMIDNRILSDKLKERYKQLRRKYVC